MPIPVFAGRITRSNLTIAAGTEPWPITITIGTIPFIIAPGIRAVTIRRFLAMISFTVLTPRGQRSGMTALETRSGWRRARSGSVAVTWMEAMVHRPDTWSAWSSFLRLIRSTARPMRAIRPRLLTLLSTRGAARLPKDVRSTRCKLLLKLKRLPESKW